MSLLFPAGYQFHDSNGDPVASGSVYFYETGTETLKAIYTDKDLSVTAANPFSLDAAGRFTGNVNIYGSGDYTVVCKDSTGAAVFSRDDVFGWGDGAPYFARTAAEIAAGVTPTAYQYEPGDVRRYGAVGNGVTDDSAAIQAAINVAAVSGGAVYVPSGTYILNGTRQGAAKAVILLKDRVSIIGDGPESVIKVADDYTDGGDYRVFYSSSSDPITNAVYSNFTLDQNGANNLVAGITGGDLRRAYGFHIVECSDLTFDNIIFTGCPGRNVIKTGQDDATYYGNRIKIHRCTFANVGGTISGNRPQNDHTCIYAQGDQIEIIDNILYNDDVPDYSTAPAMVVSAIELHGTNITCRGNICRNFVYGITPVSDAARAGYNHIVEGNLMTGITRAGMLFGTVNTFRNVKVLNNLIEMDDTLGQQLGGIVMGYSASEGTSVAAIEGLVIEGNTVCTTSTSFSGSGFPAIQVSACIGSRISNNIIRNIPGNGINILANENGEYHVDGLRIEGNNLYRYGFNDGKSTNLWGVYLSNNNADATKGWIKNVVIDRNTFIVPDAGNTSTRGIRLRGAGPLQNIIVGSENRFFGLASLSTLFETNSLGSVATYKVLPRHHSIDKNEAVPFTGVYVAGRDVFDIEDIANGYATRRVVVSSGGGYSGTWAGATAYAKGVWIKTSGNKVFECYVAGTSHASVEPTSSTLGETVTDGTVTWIYRSSTAVVLRPDGNAAGKGSTAARPTPDAIDVGVMYLDTTLDADGKPIWWNGTAWVDATGATV